MEWVNGERNTAKFIRQFWNASFEKQRNDPQFISFLMRSGWCNVSNGEYALSTREWRNQILGKYLGIEDADIKSLAKAVNKHWPKISVEQAASLLKEYTGIVQYRNSLRPAAIRFVERHASEVKRLFDLVSSNESKPQNKIWKIVTLIDKMPVIKTTNGKKTSLLNALTPTLACLDPQLRFPIMNIRTNKLLKLIDKEQDADGAVALSNIIQPRFDVRNSFELDVYSQQGNLPKHKKPPFEISTRYTKRSMPTRNLGLKSEQNSYATINRQRRKITKAHNKLTNKFKKAIQWPHKIHEDNYDILIQNWKNKKSLLVEAKTASSGNSGRSQIRQAIGQLFDYRFLHFKDKIKSVDLAVLLPSEPDKGVKDLLKSLGIEILWFKKEILDGTINI